MRCPGSSVRRESALLCGPRGQVQQHQADVRVVDAADVPARTGVAIEADTLIELSAHPRILAAKDAKGDVSEAMTVMAKAALA